MKTSDKFLGTVILALFLGSGLLKTAERISLGHESGYGNAAVANDEKPQVLDSTSVCAPGDGVKWNRVTLGLRRSFRRGIIDEGSIFRDIPLDYDYHSVMTRPFFQPFGGSTICWISFSYLIPVPDSAKKEPARGYANRFVFIHITKYRAGQRPDAIHDFMKKMHLKAVESAPGVWSYFNPWTCGCEWFSGRWLTEIIIPLASCGNDSARALELRDKIRDRMFAYYKTLQ
jgi:hypothetical protein